MFKRPGLKIDTLFYMQGKFRLFHTLSSQLLPVTCVSLALTAKIFKHSVCLSVYMTLLAHVANHAQTCLSNPGKAEGVNILTASQMLLYMPLAASMPIAQIEGTQRNTLPKRTYFDTSFAYHACCMQVK